MRSGILVVLDMVLLGSALKTESAQCHVETNGCSIPKGVPRPFVETFTPACNRHDVCYRCVSVISNLFPRTLFPGCEAGKGPGIGRPIRHFDWLIDLGNHQSQGKAPWVWQVITHDIRRFPRGDNYINLFLYGYCDLFFVVFDCGKKDSPKLGTMRVGKENDIWDSDERSLPDAAFLWKKERELMRDRDPFPELI